MKNYSASKESISHLNKEVVDDKGPLTVMGLPLKYSYLSRKNKLTIIKDFIQKPLSQNLIHSTVVGIKIENKQYPYRRKLAGLIVYAFVVFTNCGYAQFQIPVTPSSNCYYQNFDTPTLPTSGSVAWTDNLTIPFWYLQRTPVSGGTGPFPVSVVADNGSINTGSAYSYGQTGSTDRALGSIGTNNSASGNYAWGLQFNNTTGYTVSDFKVSYRGEQWRDGGVISFQKVSFCYKKSASTITNLTPSVNTGWTNVGALNFLSPTATGVGASLNGNLSPNFTILSSNLTGLILNNNEYLMMKWDDPKYTGTFDHGMAIDSVSISWTVCSPPVIQASYITSANLGQNNITLQWVNGSGSGRIIKVNTVNSFTDPSDGSSLVANSVYTGSGEQVVYNGSGSSSSTLISGLQPCTQYYFKVFEYNCFGPNSKFNNALVGANNPAAFTTDGGSLPTPYSLTGESSYCASTSSGVNIGLSNSESGVSYQLLCSCPQPNTPVGQPVAGITGSPISFGNQPIPSIGPCIFSVIGTAINSGGCSSNMASVISVSQVPVPVFSLSTINPTSCASNDGSILLDNLQINLPYLVSFSYNGGSLISQNYISNASGSIAITGLQVGSYSNLTVSNSGCSSGSLSTTLEAINPIYSVNAATACSSYSWNGNIYSTSGTYTVFFPSGSINGCDSTATLILTIHNAVSSSYAVTACSNYSWNNNNYNTTGTYTVLFPGASIEGCDSIATLNLTINNEVTSISNESACNSYTWNGNTYINSGIYTAIFHEGSSQGCDSTAVLLLTLNPLPIPNVSSNSPVCEGGTISLFGGPDGMSNYSWIGPNGFLSSEQDPIIGLAQQSHSGIYSLTITDNNGCSSSTSINVNVEPLPIPLASSNSPVCLGGTVNLIGGPDGMLDYLWTGPDGFSSHLQNPSINNISFINAGFYILQVTTDNGCVSSASTLVNINSLSIGGSLDGGGTVYEGITPISLKLTGYSGSIIKWQKQLNQGVWLNIPNSSQIYSEMPSSAGTWHYRVEVQNGNCSMAYSNEAIAVVQSRTLLLKVYLESLYNDELGQMRKAQDINGDKFGGDIADVITLCLAHSSFPYNIEYAINNIELPQSGLVTINLPAGSISSYFLVVRHRNSIETWNSFPILLNVNHTSYNFTNGAPKAYGYNQLQVGNVWVIYGGDTNQDGIVDGSDMAAADNGSTGLLKGYNVEDINGDGIVDGTDMAIIDNNSTELVTKVIPF
ncbi:MAG: hypothetical protein HXX13_16165 [Bacteroidetes bacterium]|nr:hypothetical protein [Bacteroidota bacterium]